MFAQHDLQPQLNNAFHTVVQHTQATPCVLLFNTDEVMTHYVLKLILLLLETVMHIES